MSLATSEELIEELRAGRMIILADDEDRENEGDLVMAAEWVTPEAVNFMATHGRGLICLAMTQEQTDLLQLPLMVANTNAKFKTNFTISIEAAEGVTTGISAFDRAHTIRTAIKDGAQASDIHTPGHIFPLVGREGGLLVRAGHTEASIDLARMAGLKPAGVICEIMNEDGSMARMPELKVFARKHNLKVGTIADVIRHRLQHDSLVKREVEVRMPTEFGEFRLIGYTNAVDDAEHVALVMGEPSAERPCLVRVHSECLTGDVFASRRCDCGSQLHAAMRQVSEAGEGVVLYLRQEGRGIGLLNKLKAYNLQDAGHDTVEANTQLGFKPDLRDYGIGAQILRNLGLRRLNLLTNNPKKIVALDGYGLEVCERVQLQSVPHEDNIAYLTTKREKMGHMLDLNAVEGDRS
ncbi:MAG: bifunctional 3,4-dihydroxy-2-butanone-4-phosphate synthase/GTP cyclohydrolase II [Zetaproteobacteria bacterium CG12_big_fil_rev_8_21_14_0_65_54_13]|nr:MAG: bifunctional 3,4-dihydroxy-2-butanone-4-phosphate synthase/GTP cyclohydrolase II [Zetaproteobacteria bacterium CG12_big_fil_rev_8_21_14_0_65_54_13]PIX55645.1 MAG: bifunctional 3,4-dihydroxy-2-butanone-4-phosphate synthase/GTP cyclohydrolase II [Zetaproteobacteria bacterium CG_4_10_14_3_um_filter_54_28]PJA30653.1 MAG: bifunctional 3,4-dihydroxy-2-butanone-4-phosphate synthase/GTP cyclohydrolase II [Zetaproteobacteria bacterium CG_4_9_14_3_um_filter_54_145]